MDPSPGNASANKGKKPKNSGVKISSVSPASAQNQKKVQWRERAQDACDPDFDRNIVHYRPKDPFYQEPHQPGRTYTLSDYQMQAQAQQNMYPPPGQAGATGGYYP